MKTIRLDQTMTQIKCTVIVSRFQVAHTTSRHDEVEREFFKAMKQRLVVLTGAGDYRWGK